MRRNAWSYLAWVALAAVTSSCSGGSDNPNLTDVAKQYSKAYCVKLEVCMNQQTPGVFEKVYPGGQDDCAERTLSISGTSEKSICSQAQWDTCTTDLEKTECVGAAEARRPKIPDSCQGC